MAAGRGNRWRVPLRQPQQRQVPGHPRCLDRGQRAAAAVRVPRLWRAVVPAHAGHRHRQPRPRAERARLRPRYVAVGYPVPGQQRVLAPGNQPVRDEPVRVAVQTGLVQRRRQRRVLHAGAGARALSGQRDDQRRGARGGRLVPGQRDAELLAGRGKPLGQPQRRHRSLGRFAGRSLSPHACPRQSAARRRRLVQRWLDVRRQGRRPGPVRLAAAVDLTQLAVRRLERLQLEHGVRRGQRRRRPVSRIRRTPR